jgi:Sulfotransferase family
MDLSELQPNAIGATGGSGTRVVARIVRAGGLYIGTNLNNYEDALDFAGFSDRWINTFVSANGEPGAVDLEEMGTDLESVVETHVLERPEGTPWGWKEPRSIYLLPFYHRVMPKLRFLHFIRDGRDMAFSENQNQLKKHGAAVLDEEQQRWKQPVQSIALWTRVNTGAADYGEREMGDQYLRVSFEQLCTEPAETVGRVFEFFGLEGDAAAVAQAEVRPPDTLGRWRGKRDKVVDELNRVAEPALSRFGYL